MCEHVKMPRKMNDSDIEKILINFDGSDMSEDDIDDTPENNVDDSLMGVFQNNESFLAEELSRPGNYEINIEHLDIDCYNESNLEIVGSNSFIFKKPDEFRWKKDPWVAPQDSFEEEYPKNAVKLPVDYFLSYFSDTFLDEVVYATNSTSLSTTGKSISLNKEELLKFISLEILIGTIGYPRLSMYWTKGTNIPIFDQNLTRHRFHLIRNHIKLTSIIDPEDKIFKIRPLINMFLKNSHSLLKN